MATFFLGEDRKIFYLIDGLIVIDHLILIYMCYDYINKRVFFLILFISFKVLFKDL